MKAKRRKAIALMSGGLDSQLAAKIVNDQGVETVGLHLLSPFGCRTEIESAAKSIGVPLIVREKGPSFLDLIKNPRYGYGRNMNPCIDCRILMFHIAERVMREEGADFLVTGEVLGQRPMSQRRSAKENTEISERWKKAEGVFFCPDNFDGPNAIAVGPVNNAEKQLVGEMIARYGKANDVFDKRIKFDSTVGAGEFTVSHPATEEKVNAMRI